MNAGSRISLSQLRSCVASRPWLSQFGLAWIALMLGILIYLTDRAGTPAYFVQPWMTELTDIRQFAGILQGQLPDFLHVFAFILVSAAIARPTRDSLLGICVAWLTLECLLEFGQHPAFSQSLVNWLTLHLPQATKFGVVQDFFLHGTFDWLDLASFLLGGI